MKKRRMGWSVLLSLISLLLTGATVSAAERTTELTSEPATKLVSEPAAEQQTIFNSPYVTFSPDGQAWTTNAGDTRYVWYEEGVRVHTGISSSLREPGTGEHYYLFGRQGRVPVGYWQVELKWGACVHNTYPGEEWDGVWHGIPIVRDFCGRYYYSGWFAYCADCGDRLTNMLVYMSREAAVSIDYLDLDVNGRQMNYYYLCPWNNNLEQGVGFDRHYCKSISWNQYQVKYCANVEGIYGGYMENSIHMYHNATEYEGRQITPATHLTPNAYTRIGYEFIGWNTRPDGSGTAYEDGAEILNLTDRENDVVALYAQWRRSVSHLRIDPGAGLYQGKAGETVITGSYLERYNVKEDDVTAPVGFTVNFETNGGNALEEITGTQHFVEWKLSAPFCGKFHNAQYLFTASDGNYDTLTACYMPDSITLPVPVKEGSSFGGWYYDPECTEPAGGGGDQITPDRDLTLYAQWVELTLSAEDNYSDNGERGAVDLSWTQEDGHNKGYLIYQSSDNRNWTQINEAEDIRNSCSVEESFPYTGTSGTYIVPYTGLYLLTAEGAQGGNYGGYQGGEGGRIFGTFWLRKGECLTYTIGGTNGYHGGGSGSMFANGGGCTLITSDQKGLLLVAGGGGGATSVGNGYGGGSNAGTNDVYINGESGYAGGGGGYQGGRAGSVIYHYHKNDCYRGPVICGGTDFGHYYEAHGCWDDSGDGMCDQGDGPLHGPQDTGHNHQVEWWWCKRCGTIYDEETNRCDRVTAQKMLVCGYSNGQIESANPSYGGSNYVNPSYAHTYQSMSEQKSGNGSFRVQSQSIGYQEILSLQGVVATDCAAPDPVDLYSVQKKALSESRVELSWSVPKDHGTVYYHQAESYLWESTTFLCRSNITRNVLTSGIKGYYYLVDTCSDTQVTAENAIFLKEAVQTVVVEEIVKYFHVAAVDVAGNVSLSIHIPLDMADLDLQWPIHTRQLEWESSDHIYQAPDGRVYVRSDGETPFFLHYQAYMDGRAREDYQINHAVFESRAQGGVVRNILRCESGPVREDTFSIAQSDLTLTAAGKGFLSYSPLTEASRKSWNSDLEIRQAFTLSPDADGIELEIIPIAGADHKGEVVYSDYTEDCGHGIVLTGDGTAPKIAGLEIIENLELLDRREGTVTLNCRASDEQSGVKEFFLEIYNLDNTAQMVCLPDADGVIRVDITLDQPIFSGDFVVTAHAVDHVGNESVVSAGTTEFSLASEIVRILEPHDPVFQCGESGILTITTWGYADRVEVEFPEEFLELDPGLNHTYVYTDTPAYRHTEELQFMVPLNTPENSSYTITIRAYKGGKCMEDHPSFSVVGISGTVLDDFRTRLR
ncbi:MAG: InlB B-repeat-containing protein [Candidatus Gastranaerophilales bacterium]|nr:InlB B-repeat-containing protein [Candidatus Gastranaerophilales bacterium]